MKLQIVETKGPDGPNYGRPCLLFKGDHLAYYLYDDDLVSGPLTIHSINHGILDVLCVEDKDTKQTILAAVISRLRFLRGHTETGQYEHLHAL